MRKGVPLLHDFISDSARAPARRRWRWSPRSSASPTPSSTRARTRSPTRWWRGGVARGDRVIDLRRQHRRDGRVVLGGAQGQRGGRRSSTRSPRPTSSSTCSTTAVRRRSSPTRTSPAMFRAAGGALAAPQDHRHLGDRPTSTINGRLRSPATTRSQGDRSSPPPRKQHRRRPGRHHLHLRVAPASRRA